MLKHHKVNGKISWYILLLSICIIISPFLTISPVESTSIKVNPLAFQLYRTTHATINAKEVISKEVILNTFAEKEKEYSLAKGTLQKLAMCESSLNPQATHKNINGTVDRGLFQINSKAHYEVSDKCAFDYLCATNWSAQQLKLGRGKMWVCYK